MEREREISFLIVLHVEFMSVCVSNSYSNIFIFVYGKFKEKSARSWLEESQTLKISG